MRALIVDDEPTVRLLLSRILRREVECTVIEATNGLEALDLLAREPCDFVVIDVMMPIMNGLETLEAIRSTPALRHLPVMVLSAVRDEAQVRQLVALGISAYLTKPLRPSDASARVQRFVASLASSAPVTGQKRQRPVGGLRDGARVLVVDGEAAFRLVVRSTLGRQYGIVEAESGAQGLRVCLASKPDAIILGQHLGAVSRELFLRKVHALPGMESVPVVVTAVNAGNATPPGADAVIVRTLVAEALQAQFARLFTRDQTARRALHDRPELRPQMIAAAEQVFGMMLGIEVFADPAGPAPALAGADVALVRLSLPAAATDLEFGMAARREVGERMTALCLQGADVVSDEDVASTLQEVANIICGRLQGALRSRNDVVTIGLPVVTTLAADLPANDACESVGFHNATGDVQFTTFVRPVARAAAAALAS